MKPATAEDPIAFDTATAAAIDDAEALLGVILDPKRRGSLYPYLHRLRELAPRLRTEQATGRPAWVISRYEDVRDVLALPEVRSDARGVDVFDVGPSGRAFVEMQRNTLLFLEPEKHDRVRRLVSSAFTPRAVERKRERIRRLVDTLIDDLRPDGGMDLVHDFAFRLPMIVICEMLGVPTEDLPRFYTWAIDSSRRGEIGQTSEEIIRRGEEATHGYTAYFSNLIAAHRARPADDLMSALIEARDEDGTRLSDEDLVGSCYILLQAGHGTTQDLIGMGTLALLRHPDQMNFLREDARRIPTAIEEFLRYDTSVQISQRVSDAPIRIGGDPIDAGEVCVLFNGAANRDPAIFPEPDRLDVTRDPNPHLSFGRGRHTCLGASLARLEMTITFEALLRRLPRLSLDPDQPPVYRDSLFLRGLESLPVRF